MNIPELHTIYISECNQTWCTDSRKVTKGSLFFALGGDSFDGNTFATKALEEGCAYAVVDDSTLEGIPGMILVPNVLQTLQNLAQYHRNLFTIPLLAITGSNGKTTTKELIRSVLTTTKKVIATEGNLNNFIGVPLTLLNIQGDTEIAVIELGANTQGEVAELCRICMPTHGLITNIGRDHLGFFGGIQGVLKANLEMYTHLRETKGIVFVHSFHETLVKESRGIDTILYGEPPLRSTDGTPYLTLRWEPYGDISTQLVGEYNIENIEATIAVATHFNITPKKIVKGIESYLPRNNRSELLITTKGNFVIKDYYNANASSMQKAIESALNMSKEEEKNLILILGDMFELGEYAQHDHQMIVDMIQELNPIQSILVGHEFMNTRGSGIERYSTTPEAVEALQHMDITNTVVLIKASNGMKFKDIFDSKEW